MRSHFLIIFEHSLVVQPVEKKRKRKRERERSNRKPKSGKREREREIKPTPKKVNDNLKTKRDECVNRYGQKERSTNIGTQSSVDNYLYLVCKRILNIYISSYSLPARADVTFS